MRATYQAIVYPEIDDLISQLVAVIPDNRHILKERAYRLKHKMYGIIYHVENFEGHEDNKTSNFHSDYRAPDHDSVLFDPKLVYEVESFLFQIKSMLDVLAQIVGMSYRLEGIGTYSNSGENIARKLKEARGQSALELSKIIKLTKDG